MIKDTLCTNNFTINIYTETEYTFFVHMKPFTLKECNCCIEVLLQKNQLMTIIFFSGLNILFNGLFLLTLISNTLSKDYRLYIFAVLITKMQQKQTFIVELILCKYFLQFVFPLDLSGNRCSTLYNLN